MKRLFALVLAATLAAPTIAAGFQGPNSAQGGGFQGPTTGIEADTVAKAQKKLGRCPRRAHREHHPTCCRQRR